MKLLEKLCQIHAPSSEEFRVRDFIIDYVNNERHHWVQQPKICYGKGYQDCLLLVFGTPEKAVMAHMDSIGFTAGHGNQLIPVGSPAHNHDSTIRNIDGEKLRVYFDNIDKNWYIKNDYQITPGTTWTWQPDFSIENEVVISPFLDNRLGIYTLLKIAPKLKNTILAFSTYEEMSHGGKASMLARKMYKKWKIDQILVADITWVTPFVQMGSGVAISLRDVAIPRKKFTDQILHLARQSGIPFQLEIEKAGGSDGTLISASDYPVDWIFIGAPEINPHGNTEKVHVNDIQSMIDMYAYLCKHL